jgi:hypothetical protein
MRDGDWPFPPPRILTTSQHPTIQYTLCASPISSSIHPDRTPPLSLLSLIPKNGVNRLIFLPSPLPLLLSLHSPICTTPIDHST